MKDRELKIWRMIFPPILYFFMQMAMEVFIVIIVLFAETIGIYKKNILINDATAVTENIQSLLDKNASYIVFLVAVAGIFIFGREYYKEYQAGKMISNKKIAHKEFILPIVLAISMSIALSTLLSSFELDNIYGSYEVTANSLLQGNIIYRIIALGVAVPVVEEIIYRGLVYNRIRNEFGYVRAVILSSLAFGIFHFNLVQGIYAFFIGMICSYCYEKYGDLKVSISMHMVINIISVLLDYYGIKSTLMEGIAAPIAIILVGFMVATCSLEMIYKRK